MIRQKGFKKAFYQIRFICICVVQSIVSIAHSPLTNHINTSEQ